jgi:hypothetical protein
MRERGIRGYPRPLKMPATGTRTATAQVSDRGSLRGASLNLPDGSAHRARARDIAYRIGVGAASRRGALIRYYLERH